MQTKVRAWGNSQGIRLSKQILEEAKIFKDDILEVNVQNGVITLMKPVRHKTLEERALEFGGDLKLDGEIDWGTPMGREVW
ncbi:MAG: AbrB/MazE/SpoVT family DNA-binding domain-containing protein [Pseudobutyrivibrio sp.]|nr:AbrB/MazE/SpoVT family DNA-binding domain-containing protein [Pseudobutyrivibrio sp.]